MVPRKVLIVEGVPGIRWDLEARLAFLGFETSGVASSAREALHLVEQTLPDVALIDASLSGEVDGIALVELLSGSKVRVPVLLTVDDTDEATLRRIRAAPGSPYYLLRPFANRDLRLALTLATDPDPFADPAPLDRFEDRFFDIAIDLLCCLRFNGHFARLNPAWESALGFTREELMSRPFIEFVHPDDRERTLEQNRRVRSGEQARMFENRYLCKDGSYRWLLWNATPDSGRDTIYSVARDITDWKKAQAEREGLVQQLRAALAEVKSLRDILPTCAYCRKVRDDDEWLSMEDYVSRHTNSRFSHGICPTCFQDQLGKLDEEPLPS